MNSENQTLAKFPMNVNSMELEDTVYKVIDICIVRVCVEKICSKDKFKGDNRQNHMPPIIGLIPSILGSWCTMPISLS